ERRDIGATVSYCMPTNGSGFRHSAFELLSSFELRHSSLTSSFSSKQRGYGAMPDPMSERVMVVPSRLLDELGRFQGFWNQPERHLAVLLDKRHIRFSPRSQMEEDPSYKQIIPYCILRSGEWVFRYTRGKKMGERRLHALESIGVGGHIS